LNTTTRRVLRGDHNQCPSCNEYFNSTAAFEKHRTGDYATGPNGSIPARRCLTIHEMQAKGMSKNSSDWWITMASERDPQADHGAAAFVRRYATPHT
jgi:hypothetical protein